MSNREGIIYFFIPVLQACLCSCKPLILKLLPELVFGALWLMAWLLPSFRYARAIMESITIPILLSFAGGWLLHDMVENLGWRFGKKK